MIHLMTVFMALTGAFAASVEQAPALSARQLTQIQGVLAVEPLRPLLSLDPGLAAVANLDPKIDSHLEALGVMAPQQAAGQPLAAADVLRAYYSPENLAQMESVLRRRTDELRTAQDPRSAAELGALADLGAGIKSKGMAQAAANAKKIAASLNPNMKPQDDPEIEWVSVLEPRPMQFGVGMAHEVVKKRKMLEKMTPAQQRAYLLKHPIPVVERENGAKHVNKGPMGRKQDRPDDHHHLLRAAWEAGITQIPIKKEKEDKTGGKKFWKSMRKDDLVYLYDEFGNGPHDPQDLPLDVRGLADDPYRDLAGWVRDLGAYKKTSAPFAEFQWAKFFRENLKTHPHKDWKGAVKEAMALARTRAAKDLPGYKGEKNK